MKILTHIRSFKNSGHLKSYVSGDESHAIFCFVDELIRQEHEIHNYVEENGLSSIDVNDAYVDSHMEDFPEILDENINNMENK